MDLGVGSGETAVTQGWKTTVIVISVAGIMSTPMIWLLGNPNVGQLAGASIQAAVGIGALILALFQNPQSGPDDMATKTGMARAHRGGSANAGIKRPGGRSAGSAKVERSGDVSASDDGSSANSGIDYS